MSTPADTYAVHADRFGDVVAVAVDGDWTRPSPCEGWTSRDVVGHVVESQRAFLDRTGHPVPEADVGTDPEAAWRSHRDAVATLLADPSVSGAAYQGYFGDTTVGEMLADFYGFDAIAHRWDLAKALGRDTTFDDDELDILEAGVRQFGEHLYQDGVCRPALEVPGDVDRQGRILATMGRDPAWHG